MDEMTEMSEKDIPAYCWCIGITCHLWKKCQEKRKRIQNSIGE